jgi:hypothetical protein
MCYFVTGCFNYLCQYTPSFLSQKLPRICNGALRSKTHISWSFKTQSHQYPSPARVPICLLYNIDLYNLTQYLETHRQNVRLYVCMYVCTHARTHACMYVCTVMCIKIAIRVTVSDSDRLTFLGSLLEAMKGNFGDVSFVSNLFYSQSVGKSANKWASQFN